MPSKLIKSTLGFGLIALHFVVLGLAYYSWGTIYGWWPHTAYDLFPLLGLLAFSLMWIHYVAAAVNRFYHSAFNLKKYFAYTGYAVLALIILHPGILIYSLWRDGFGLPPGSYLNYVGKTSEAAVLFGTAAWVIFITYEFVNRLKHMRFWPVMVGLNDVAMGLIFFHARKLGTSQNLHWFHLLWMFYGLVLILCIAQRLYFIYQRKHRSSTPVSS